MSNNREQKVSAGELAAIFGGSQNVVIGEAKANVIGDEWGTFAVNIGDQKAVTKSIFAGRFNAHFHKTDSGYFVGIECVSNDGCIADFQVSATAGGSGLMPNYMHLNPNNSNHNLEKKPTYLQLEAERDNLLAELKALR